MGVERAQGHVTRDSSKRHVLHEGDRSGVLGMPMMLQEDIWYCLICAF